MSTEQSEPITHYGDDGHSAAGSSEAVGSTSPERGTATGTAGGGNNGRRRRRRRKSKAGGGAPAAAAAQQTAGGEVAQDTAPAPPPTPAPPVQAQNSQPQGGGQFQGGGKRKKNRKRGSGPSAPEPGNRDTRPQPQRQNAWKARNADGPDGNREGARGGFGSGEHFSDNLGNGNGGTRRKGKFGAARRPGFVGPMDHSYRVVNGNVADAPPSTMDFRSGNGSVNGRNDFRENEPVAIVKEDAPARIVCFIEDLFVVAKMQEAAKKLGVKIQFAKAEKETLAAITDAPDADRPSLIVFDLNNGGAKPLTAIPKLKAKLKRGTSIIGFLQQIQGDLKMKAIEAGCDTVMPKAAFSQNLSNLLRRHGLAEEEEEFAGA